MSSVSATAARGKKKPAQQTIRESLLGLRKRGFNRLYQGGRVFEFATPEELLDVDFNKTVYVLVDRLATGPEMRPRLVDSVEIAYREGRGEAILEFVPDTPEGAAERMTFQRAVRRARTCGTEYQEPEPRLFSFNNPYGACPRCQGFGNTVDFDLDRVIPDKSKSLADGAIEPWTKPRYRPLAVEMKKFARAKGIPVDVPFRELTTAQQSAILDGDKKEGYEGVKGFFTWLERKKYKLHVRVFLSRYRGYATCPECKGTRLRAEARAVKIAGKSITEVCQMTVKEARPFFAGLALTESEAEIVEKVLEEIQQRLRFLDEVGLDYLSLDRLTSTLSGGESQRIQLATSLGSHLVGALYVLDEPSIGLHPRDTTRLIEIMKGLRDLGNTLVVVEHDPDTILAADKILDLGPGAGEHGGKLIFSGTREEIMKDPHSLTGKYLRGELKIAVPARRRKPLGKFLKIFGARSHNRAGRGRDRAAGDAGGGDGRVGLGQIDAGVRRYLQGAAGEANGRKLPGVLRQDRRRPGDHGGGDGGPIADWKNAAVESGDVFEGVRSDSRSVCGDAGSEEARIHAGTLFVQHSGRTMRGVPGRWNGDGGDAVPGGCGVGVRGMPRDAVQNERAGCAVQGAQHSRCAADDGAGGAGVFRAVSESDVEAARAG